MPPTFDDSARCVVIGLIAWQWLQHYRARRLPGTELGQWRRRWGANVVLVGLVVGYTGGVFDSEVTPWFSRTLISTGLVLMASGYRLDRKAAPDARPD